LIELEAAAFMLTVAGGVAFSPQGAAFLADAFGGKKTRGEESDRGSNEGGEYDEGGGI
jgi:hypothetical protein